MSITVATRLSGSERAVALLEAWRIADADADIEIRAGRTADGEPCVLVSIGQGIKAGRTTP